jgi:large subunit ribosomal protein L29
MTVNELRGLEPDELSAKALELKRKVWDLRMKLKSGRLDSTADIQKSRRELARALTVIRERELGIRREAGEKK